MIAGPNGSGKSSLYSNTDIEAFDQSVWIINPDLLTERIRRVENLTLEQANLEAVIRIEIWLEASIRAHQTVGVETVLSTDKYRRLVLAAKKNQFEFRLIYVLLDSPDRNVERVRLRVKKGGHDVPERKVRDRWAKSILQLPWFLEQADQAFMFDNTGASLRQTGLKQGGRIIIDPCAPAVLRAQAGTGMIIAIDGPAASGKGTIAKQIAEVYGLHHLDTGLLYRAVAKAMLDAGDWLDDAARAAAAARALDPSRFDERTLKSQTLGEAASVVSAIPAVRDALITYQRQFAIKPSGAVLDGRDIGTVIAPGADVKIFVTATPQVRAARRTLELRERGETVNEEDVLADILRRDERDTERATAPLKPAPDAHLLDTTHLGIDAAFRAAVTIIEAARTGRKRR